MKTKFFYSMIFIVGLAFSGLTLNSLNAQTVKKTEKKAQKVVYVCPECTGVVSDKPGKCPKCGMALVEKKEVTKMKKEVKGEMKSKMDTTKMKHTYKMKEKK